MKRMIPIVDLKSGTVSDRPGTTLTLDLPQDFDRSETIAELDEQSRVRYLSVQGKTMVKSSFPRPLSWRVHGEECLVSERAAAATAGHPSKYSLFAVE